MAERTSRSRALIFLHDGVICPSNDFGKARFIDEAARLSSDASIVHAEELAAKMRTWAKIYRSEMDLDVLELRTLHYLRDVTQRHVSNTTTSPGERLVALICLHEIKREIERRIAQEAR